MVNRFERGVDKIKDMWYSVKHPNAIVSRRVAEYLDDEFGKPQPKRGILFRLTPRHSKLSPNLKQYIYENM